MSHLVLVLVFALVWTVVQCSCPTMCRCNNFALNPTQSDFYIVATCTEIPQNFQNFTEKLQEITLINTTIDLQYEIEHFPQLKRVSLKNNIETMTNLSLPSNITHLDLSGNNLENFEDSNTTLTRIKILDISHNNFNILRNYSFRTMNQLEVLNISFNNISFINRETFEELDNLKCLDLSGNSITNLYEIFSHLTSLQYLNLSRNRLEKLDENCFSDLAKLQQLDISSNKLKIITPGTFELPNLARLILFDNPQLGKTKNSNILVNAGRKLQNVDASRIGLQQVPPTLTPSIRSLKLSGNEIKSIHCGDLDSYPLLQVLDFTSNQINCIEDDALGRLDSLTILLLSDNKIREIPKSLPEKLQVVRIDRNALERVAEGDLLGLIKLEVLLLSDNKIRIIEERAFSQLTSLVTLDLSRNPLSVLQTGFLTGPFSLEILHLSGIELISPAKDVSFPLSAPEKLIMLDLSYSPGLTGQFLADTAVLAASKQLQELNLSHTNLEVIRFDLLHYLPQLRNLHLDGNKLNCSSLQWLAAWMRRQDGREYSNVICSNPPDLWGTALIDLQDDDIDVTTQKISNSTTTRRMENKNELLREKSTTLYVDIEPNTIFKHWNGTADELSSERSSRSNKNFHPSVIILFSISTIFAIIVLFVFFKKFKNKKSIRNINDERDIEVSSIPSVTELW